MTQKRTASEIEEEAVAWATRLDRGALTAEEEGDLDRWLASDTRCVGALARAEAFAEASNKIAALDPDVIDTLVARRTPPKTLSRRDFYKYGAIAAGVTAIGAGAFVTAAAANTYETRKGEMKVVTLSDGSTINLNTLTKVKVEYGGTRRVIHLLHGEALFDVARDRRRPFIVIANTTYVTATGTSFTVGLLPDRPLTVLVREGSVQLNSGASTQSLRVATNTRAVVRSADAIEANAVKLEAVSVEQVSDDLAWKAGRIAFKGETLGEAAHEFDRYSDVHIVVDDPGLANERIAGVFEANDPVGFAHTVADSFDLNVAIEESRVRLSRKRNT